MEMSRIKKINQNPILSQKEYVLYWIHSGQRVNFNPSLNYAVELSNFLKKPLLCFFGLTEAYPEANERHFKFLLEGLKDLQVSLKKNGIKLIVIKGDPVKICTKLSNNAAAVVCDKGYLRIEKFWNFQAAEHVECAMFEVDNNVVVPVDVCSSKEEYSAATLRKKITPFLEKYLEESQEKNPIVHSLDIEIGDFDSLSLEDPSKAAKQLDIDHSVKPISWLRGGESSAKKMLKNFISNKLPIYAEKRSDPGFDALSNMSPYLHFGHISPVYIAISITKSKTQHNNEAVSAYLEELIVRRELAFNFVYYNKNYDTYENSVPNWAKESLFLHKTDKHQYLYSLKQLEKADTHDEYWNAAQTELLSQGKMHSYMRMYWCKKIIEWSPSPEQAFKYSIYLNNKYSLDGRDPNSFAGIAWCFGKHDRAWKERDIFGKVRYMSHDGLKRKFHMDVYLNSALKN